MSTRVLSPHYKCPHHFSTARDDKVNDCGFNINVACEWRVLCKEDKDDSLQFAKVFLHHHFALYSIFFGNVMV